MPGTSALRAPIRAINRAETPSDIAAIPSASGRKARPTSDRVVIQDVIHVERAQEEHTEDARDQPSSGSGLPTVTSRDLNTRNGISGLAAVAWRSRKPAISASATPPNPSVCAEPQP